MECGDILCFRRHAHLQRSLAVRQAFDDDVRLGNAHGSWHSWSYVGLPRPDLEMVVHGQYHLIPPYRFLLGFMDRRSWRREVSFGLKCRPEDDLNTFLAATILSLLLGHAVLGIHRRRSVHPIWPRATYKL